MVPPDIWRATIQGGMVSGPLAKSQGLKWIAKVGAGLDRGPDAGHHRTQRTTDVSLQRSEDAAIGPSTVHQKTWF